MTRIYNIDEDTAVGYYYNSSKFFIRNKGTETLRQDLEEALKVVQIVASIRDEDLPNMRQKLIDLRDNYEIVKEVYYTLSDEGSYVATIQLNDYAENPITLDGERKKLYIMNTNIIFDLILNEPLAYLLQTIHDYYLDTLGLQIPREDILKIHGLMISFFVPHVYNVVAKNTDDFYNPLSTETEQPKYSTEIRLEDYKGNSNAKYSVLLNPYNKFTNTLEGYIKKAEGNVITLTNNAPELKLGDTIIISNSNEEISEGNTYGNDGEYTVVRTLDNLIAVSEMLPVNYETELAKCSIIAYPNEIVKVDRETREITLTNLAAPIMTGDIITIEGTEIKTEYETLTIDGEYEVENVKDNIIVLADYPITSYEYTEEPTESYPQYTSPTKPIVFKRIHVGSVLKIEKNVLGFEEPIHQLPFNTPISIQYSNREEDRAFVKSTTEKTLTISGTIEDYLPNYALLEVPKAYTEALLVVKDTKSDRIFPNGTFMLDNHEQLSKYIKLYIVEDELVPTQEQIDNALNQKYVPKSYPLNLSTLEEKYMTFKGLYSEFYKDKTDTL